MVHLQVCQSDLSTIQGERHPTGGQHNLSGNIVKRRRGLLRLGRTALRLLPIRRHRLSKASQLGRTRRATRVCFRRDTPWMKLAFQASFRCAVLRSMSGCCRTCISRARFLSSWQAWMSCCTAQTVRPLTFSRLRVCLSRQ